MMRRLTVAGVVLAVVTLGGWAIYLVWYGQRPPPLQSAGPGTVRLDGPLSPGVPAAPSSVRLSDGSTITLQFGYAELQAGRPVASVGVLLSRGDARWLHVYEGDHRRVGKVTVRALRIWVEPNPRNQAVDVQVTSG